jgi:hypothetical protein
MRGHMLGGSRVHDPLAYGLAMVSILCCKGIVIIVLGFVGILLVVVLFLALKQNRAMWAHNLLEIMKVI